MIKLSFIYITYRPGGYDILADSLVNQTYKDYEVIIVDDFQPDRSEAVRKYLQGKGIAVKYAGPSKQKCFPELSFGIFNAANTGFIIASGDACILCTDYQWFPPDCFEKIARHETKIRDKTCIVLPARTWESYNARLGDGIISVWKKEWKGPPQMNNCVEAQPWIPKGMEFAFTAFPTDILEDMNGYPEYLDAVPAQPLGPIMECFDAAGAKAYVDTDNFMFAINHRRWEPAESWYQSARAPSGPTELIKRPNTFDLKAIHGEQE